MTCGLSQDMDTDKDPVPKLLFLYHVCISINHKIINCRSCVGLTILNLAVADGTIKAFILYAYVNIISISNSLFFPQCTPAYTLISLVNLDLGIQTCFCIGMDDSTSIQRLTACRALPVLATLFLLSYTKILLIVSDVLFSYSSITHILDKHTMLVWSVDANVPLFGFRYTILFVVCFIILLVQIPFSIILLSSKKIIKI